MDDGFNDTYFDDYYARSGHRDDSEYYYGDKAGRAAREDFYRDWFIYIDDDDIPDMRFERCTTIG